jgi:hypothetical protein
MTVSRREKKLRLLSLLALPLLLAVAFAVNARRNVEDYVRQIETSVRPVTTGQTYAGAEWQVEKVRLIGDGRDAKVTFPGQMRLVIVQLKATARDQIGEGWSQCRFTLVDDQGRRWLPLDPTLSRDISRDLDRKATPVDGCGITSLHPPAKDASVTIEEKFVVPADVLASLKARLSFFGTRPEAIDLPLKFD